MNKIIIDSFMLAANEVLSESGFSGFDVAAEAVDMNSSADVLAILGLTGDIKGHFVVHTELNAASNFVKALSEQMGLHDADHSDHGFRKSAMAEITNQLGGRATIRLADSDYDAMITPPMVISGSSIAASLPESNERAAFRISGKFGSLVCVIALKSAKSL